MEILVTGGAGYIGSHTCLELLQAGYEVVVIDNLSNSQKIALDRIEQLAGKPVTFYENDVMDMNALEQIFTQHDIEAVIHFAGLKAVGESVALPLSYYKNNLVSSLVLFEVMARHNVKKLVFSSSATVYGVPETTPIDESAPRSTTNPYGATKLMIEQMLEDVAASDTDWEISLLRYFNPIGADISGLIGEDPNGIPNNLMPYVTQVAAGRLDELSVYGQDYETPDGTGIRDYIHVVDLAKGHLKALEYKHQGIEAFNLGTGTGSSVLDLVTTFESATGIDVKRKFVDRRPGDVAACYADASKAERLLGWKAEKTLYDMCQDAWRWQSQNPEGYPREMNRR
ncbi:MULTISPECIES: UDP-glucose 4-epimerase GalE [unclassified Exiguobacterium]|uniref:UDP-glucose 4-epimerase GalE n=1 Tax=unclassified Exiguobacterium TaxID=2644629 RepID=UPI000B588D3F|nr:MULTISPECIES: UDP-glucose 4-epimerase GalE [unclassified Exiguobacterium]ASI36421.1 UDP-glucose 4-epimerase GalE [Exiguobacterium sp. N4-1P]